MIPAHAEAWIAFARRPSVRLRDDIDRARILADTNPAAFAQSGASRTWRPRLGVRRGRAPLAVYASGDILV